MEARILTVADIVEAMPDHDPKQLTIKFSYCHWGLYGTGKKNRHRIPTFCGQDFLLAKISLTHKNARSILYSTKWKFLLKNTIRTICFGQ